MMTPTINWAPFSEKHINYIKQALKDKMSVAEGSVRAGKTIDNCVIAQAYLEICPDKIHLASGSSIANAKLNIGDCNGFGLEHLFRGRCRWGKYKDNEALYLDTKTGEKIVIFAGGSKSDSYKKILGNSYGLWIATEINEHYDSEDSKTSFIKVAFARQVASIQPKVLWDLNPSNPHANIYTCYIDKYLKDGLKGGYNYGHFTIDDNLSISEDRKEEIKSQYDENSIWYKRDILGLRVTPDGLCFPKFAEETERYIMKEFTQHELENYKRQLVLINIGVDFGGNKSKHTFVCTGFTRNFMSVDVLESERIETKNISPAKLDELYVEFVRKCYNKYGKPINSYPDSAEQVLINGFRIASARAGLPNQINNARKNPINDRIKLTNKLVDQNRFRVKENCKDVIDALCEAIWDNKQAEKGIDERLDNGTTNIDTLDALEYSIEPQMNNLLMSKGGQTWA